MQGVGAASAEDGFIVRALPRPLASTQLPLRAAHPHPDKSRAQHTKPVRLFCRLWEDSRLGRNDSGVMQICGALHKTKKQARV